MAGRATIEDVARTAGVSVATVSRALRNMPNVAPATRERVALVADQLGYEPHAAASWLASGRTMTIGFVGPYFDIWYTGQVLAGIENVLSDAGYDLAVYAADTPANRGRFLERVGSLQTRVDGLVLVDFHPEPRHLHRLADIGIPTVVIGEHVEPLPSLAIDNEEAAHRAVSYLVGLGHRRIGIMGELEPHPEESPVLRARRLGYEQAMTEAALEPSSELRYHTPLGVEGGAAGFDLLGTAVPPTALFCLSDETAMGLMSRAAQAGVVVGSDLSVVGFDDHDLADAFGLTTMRQPVREIGIRGAELLMTMIGEGVTSHEAIRVPVELVERSSSGPPVTGRN